MPETTTSAHANAAMWLEIASWNKSGMLRPCAESHGTNWERGKRMPMIERRI